MLELSGLASIELYNQQVLSKSFNMVLTHLQDILVIGEGTKKWKAETKMVAQNA